MSKFSEALKVSMGDRVSFNPSASLKHVEFRMDTVDTPLAYNVLQEVKIGVTFRVNKWVTKENNNNENIEHSLNDMRRVLVEELFGEFRPKLMEMYSASHEGDSRKMRELVNQLERHMFDV